MDYYTLTRQDVSKKLQISTRTLDRYVAKKTFSTKKKSGKVFFHIKEIEDFNQEKNTESIDINSTPQSTRLRHIQEQFSPKSSENNLEENVQYSLSKDVTKDLLQEKFILEKKALEFELQAQMYKKMYETTHQLFQTQQKQIQNAYLELGENKQKEKTLSLASPEKLEVQKVLLEQSHTELQIEKKENTQLYQKLQSSQTIQTLYFITTIASIIFFSFFFALQ